MSTSTNDRRFLPLPAHFRYFATELLSLSDARVAPSALRFTDDPASAAVIASDTEDTRAEMKVSFSATQLPINQETHPMLARAEADSPVSR